MANKSVMLAFGAVIISVNNAYVLHEFQVGNNYGMN